MRVIKYKPKNKSVTGEVDIKLPGYREMVKMMLSKGFVSKADGTFATKDDNNLEVALQLADMAAEHVSAVSLKRKDGLMEYNSFDDLEYDQDGIEVVNEVALFILSSQKLGKN